MSINYIEKLPDRDEYFDLFNETGWNIKYKLTADELQNAISNSWYALSAYHSDRLVGFGRVIADGINHALIVDMIVTPDFQGKGIGKTILMKIVDKCKASKIRDIQLFSAKGKSGFYEKFDFAVRSDDAPGMQLNWSY